MPNIKLDWTHSKSDWGIYLKHLNAQQKSVAEFIGVSDQVMTKLVKTMTDGQDLTASSKDQDRWKRAIEYVKFKESQGA